MSRILNDMSYRLDRADECIADLRRDLPADRWFALDRLEFHRLAEALRDETRYQLNRLLDLWGRIETYPEDRAFAEQVLERSRSTIETLEILVRAYSAPTSES